MTTVLLSPVFNDQQFQDNNGVVLNGGQIVTYVATSFSDMATTYTNGSGSTPNTNPIVLDADGRLPSGIAIWLVQGWAYNMALYASDGTTLIKNFDNITGTTTPALSVPPGGVSGQILGNDDGEPIWQTGESGNVVPGLIVNVHGTASVSSQNRVIGGSAGPVWTLNNTISTDANISFNATTSEFTVSTSGTYRITVNSNCNADNLAATDWTKPLWLGTFIDVGNSFTTNSINLVSRHHYFGDGAESETDPPPPGYTDVYILNAPSLGSNPFFYVGAWQMQFGSASSGRVPGPANSFTCTIQVEKLS